MRTRSLFTAALSVVASLSIAGSALAFSGITNGSFENGTFSGALWDTLYPGSTNITGWTIESGSVDLTGSYWPASDGSLSIDLSGQGPGAISQALATTVGNTYTVTFDLSGNPACGPAVKTGTVSATGGSTDAFSYDTAAAGNTLSDMKWVGQTYSFVATAASTTLTFTSTTGTTCGPALDNVDVTETVAPPPVLEPATTADCKDAGWVALVDGAGNHFNNQGDCVSYVATDHRNVAAATRQAERSAPVRHVERVTGKPLLNVSKPVGHKLTSGRVNSHAPQAGHSR
jgi:choice-of-anchor C domain-containing protein